MLAVLRYRALPRRLSHWYIFTIIDCDDWIWCSCLMRDIYGLLNFRLILFRACLIFIAAVFFPYHIAYVNIFEAFIAMPEVNYAIVILVGLWLIGRDRWS